MVYSVWSLPTDRLCGNPDCWAIKAQIHLLHIKSHIPYWYLISRFWRESISRGFIFAISTRKVIKFRNLGILNFILFLKNFQTFSNFYLNWKNNMWKLHKLTLFHLLKIQNRAQLPVQPVLNELYYRYVFCILLLLFQVNIFSSWFEFSVWVFNFAGLYFRDLKYLRIRYMFHFPL